MRNMPHEIDTEDIFCDLKKKQIISVDAVYHIHRRGGAPCNMVLVVCSPVEDNFHPIFEVARICSLKIERPHRNGIVGQCHRCQLYGQSQRNCHGKPLCVKFLGDHGTQDCSRPKDRKLCVDPPSCVLCGESGHPTNYRGCPKAPKSSTPKLAKRENARQQRKAPP